MSTISDLTIRLGLNQAGFAAGAKGARSTLNSLSAAATSVKGLVGGVAVALGARAVISGFKGMVTESMETIDATAKVADRLGITTEALLGLRHAADLSGVANEEFDKSLGKMTRTIGDAVAGSTSAEKAFTAIGLSAKDLVAMSPDQAFGAIADGLNKLPNAAARASVANDIFGKSGEKLLNTLSLGSAGIKAQADELQKLGGSFSRIDAAQVEAANDAMSRMGKVTEGVSTTVAIRLAPFIEAAANKMIEMGTEGEGMGPKVNSAFDMIASGAGVVADVFHTVGMAWDGVNVIVAGGIAGILTGLAGLAEGLQELLNKIPGVEVQFGDSMRKMADAAQESATQQAKDLKAKFLADPPSVRIDAAIGDIKKKADEAAARAAADLEAKKAADQASTADLKTQAGLEQLKKGAEGVMSLFSKAQKEGSKLLRDKGKELIDASRTPLEQYEAKLRDLQSLKFVGALGEGAMGESVFQRNRLAALKELEQATGGSDRVALPAALERGTAAAFSAERQGNARDKTEKDILAEAKRQTLIQEQQLRAFQENGTVTTVSLGP